MLKARHHILGLFILWHVVAVVSPMLPNAPIDNTVGVVRQVAQGWNRLRSRAYDTTVPYRRHLGVRQGWSMFSNVSAETGRMEIHVQEAGAWRPLFIERSAEADWNASVFDQYRWREAMRVVRFKPKERQNRKRLSIWIAERIFTEMPEVEAVRIDSVALKTPSPKEYRRTGELIRGTVRRTKTITREDP
ncbi:MAG: hypothetical protein ACI8RZ_005570 [Myxococcota bacterium]|jgi:hypothetical protein